MKKQTRRRFLQTAVAGCFTAGLLDGCGNTTDATPRANLNVAIEFSPDDTVATSTAAQWAIGHLRQTLERNDVLVLVNQPGPADLRIAVAGPARAAIADQPESLRISADERGLRVAGSDARGLVYALTELADRVACTRDVRQALTISNPIAERPANRIRGIMRLFASDVEDKQWFYARDFWQRYLTMLAGQRFNRFNLALGLGYDAARQLRDTYFFFSYPYLLNVPGYSVRASPLPDEERQRNLEMLKFISEQTVLRGMQFQLGLWTHGFQWTDSPHANYVIEGLTPATQSDYCRDALHLLLQECPAIGGVTLRIHGESGVPEGNYDFWKSLFGGIAQTGRKIEIDMHGKGMDQRMLDVAQESGLPVTVSPKFWAEHMGLPYMQASIRQQEMPPARANAGFYSLSSGSRSFLRYSYGDLLTRDRKYSVLHRVWPGTQRLLLWGDPLYAAAYGRLFSFCGSDGVEYFDPLSFKGRKGSGLPNNGGRDGYADAQLRAPGGDWEKFLHTYRLLGRLAYNPGTSPDVWQRQLRRTTETDAGFLEPAVAMSSRILPLITSAHCPSAANANYWPEIYTNMPFLDAANPGPYTDTPRPRNFCNVSPLDPRIFMSVEEYSQALLSGKPDGRYTPADVAARLETWARQTAGLLAQARGETRGGDSRRMMIDAKIASGIGAFFAWKFRAATLMSIFDHTGDTRARDTALDCCSKARAAWSDLSQADGGAYLSDLTFGPDPQLRGHWRDRLAAIDADIASLQTHQANVKVTGADVAEIIAGVLSPPQPRELSASHTPPASFAPAAPLRLELRVTSAVKSVRLWYRHINQAEAFQQAEMAGDANTFTADVPGHYTDSPFYLQYHFEILGARGDATLYPGLGPQFATQPYFVVKAVS